MEGSILVDGYRLGSMLVLGSLEMLGSLLSLLGIAESDGDALSLGSKAMVDSDDGD